MSRQAKIIIFSVILIFSYFLKNDEPKKIDTYKPETTKKAPRKNNTPKKSTDFTPGILDDISLPAKYFPTPQNGFSPYDKYVGKGIYDNSSGNQFEIKNSNSSHAVVLLVDAYTGKKVRNEFVRKGSDFLMTGVPNGTYYLQWFSGNDWSPELKIGGFTGGFQTKQSFTKTRDRSDWMKVDGYMKWSVTLYTVEGGDVESEKINPNEFLN